MAGSPASRRPSKLTPLTTFPSRTSRHAMMRLDNIRLRSFKAAGRQAQPVAQDVKTDAPGFFGMKLHAGHVAALDCGAERHSVLANGGRIADHRSREWVREVDLRSVLNSRHQAAGARQHEGVPADMWHFQRS